MDRRSFLKFVGASAAAATVRPWGSVLAAGSTSRPASLRAPMGVSTSGRSMVRAVTGKTIFAPTGINRRALRDMIRTGVRELMGGQSFKKALHEIFSEKDVIGLKFDRMTDDLTQTNQAVCEELLRLFDENGFSLDRIMPIDAVCRDPLLPSAMTTPFGWTEPMDFRSGTDQFRVALEKVTAIVNVPLLRADSVSQMSGCLRNAAFGFVRHSGRYFANEGSPFIADIYNLPIIRKNVRLNIVNALKVVLRRDVLERAGAVLKNNTLVFSFDPVAADAFGYETIERQRKRRKLASLSTADDFPKHLIDATARRIGNYHPDEIDFKQVLPIG